MDEKKTSSVSPTFVDLFSGCGGLSLGLMQVGWHGLFAIEQSPDAFKTLRHNLIDGNDHNNERPRFAWPEWLDLGPHEISAFLEKHQKQLKRIRSQVHLVAGGPPCQGFSFAGKRSGKDVRNELFRHHLQVVDVLQPILVLMENVQGIDTAFGASLSRTGKKRRGRPRKSYAHRIYEMLEQHGYIVQQHVIRAVDFAVPQYRPRYFTLGIRKDFEVAATSFDLMKELDRVRRDFYVARGLSPESTISVSDAISDLRTANKSLVDCLDPESPLGFKQIVYEGPETDYQKLLRAGLNGQAPNSLRLVNHQPNTIARFREILKTCRKGVQLSEEDRKRLGIRKTAIAPLAADQPSHTLTTLPDDLIHYAEPRIHTVREHARLQSFPDWFEFRGKYTTGGDRRTRECPRYTQVGNAVPPLLAEAIGEVLLEFLATVLQSSGPSKPSGSKGAHRR